MKMIKWMILALAMLTCSANAVPPYKPITDPSALLAISQSALGSAAGNANNYHQDQPKYARLSGYSGTALTLTTTAPTGHTASMYTNFHQYDAIIDLTHPTCIPANTVINSGQGTVNLVLSANSSGGSGCAANDVIQAWQPHLYLGRVSVNPDGSCGTTADWAVIQYCNDIDSDQNGRNMSYVQISCVGATQQVPNTCAASGTVGVTITNLSTLATSNCTWASSANPTTIAIAAVAVLNSGSCPALASTVSGNYLCAGIPFPLTGNVACQEDFPGYSYGASTSSSTSIELAFNSNQYSVTPITCVKCTTTIAVASSFVNGSSTAVSGTAGTKTLKVANASSFVAKDTIVDVTNPGYISGNATINAINTTTNTLTLSQPILVTITGADSIISVPNQSVGNSTSKLTWYWGDVASLPSSMSFNIICTSNLSLGSLIPPNPCPTYSDQATSPLPFYSSSTSMYLIVNGTAVLVPSLAVVDPTDSRSPASALACLLGASHAACVAHIPCNANSHCYISPQTTATGFTGPNFLSDYDGTLFTDQYGNSSASFQCDARNALPAAGSTVPSSSCVGYIDVTPSSPGFNLATVSIPVYAVSTSNEVDLGWADTPYARIAQQSPGNTQNIWGTGAAVPAVIHVTVGGSGGNDYYYMYTDNPLASSTKGSIAAGTCTTYDPSGANCHQTEFGARTRGLELTQQLGPDGIHTSWFAKGAGAAIHGIDASRTAWAYSPVWNDQAVDQTSNYHSLFVDNNNRIIMLATTVGITQPLGYQGGPSWNMSWGSCVAPPGSQIGPYMQYGCFRALPAACTITTETNCVSRDAFTNHTQTIYSWPWNAQGYITVFYDRSGAYWFVGVWQKNVPANYLTPFNWQSYSQPNLPGDTFLQDTGTVNTILGAFQTLITPENWTFN